MHIIDKISSIQTKESVWKTSKEKTYVPYKGKTIGIAADFSLETLKSRRDWSKTFQVLKDHDGQLRLIYPATLYTIAGKERKKFHNINSLKKLYPAKQT